MERKNISVTVRELSLVEFQTALDISYLFLLECAIYSCTAHCTTAIVYRKCVLVNNKLLFDKVMKSTWMSVFFFLFFFSIRIRIKLQYPSCPCAIWQDQREQAEQKLVETD